MNKQAISVMFIDDDPLILNGLRRRCRRIRPEWDARYAESGEDALSQLTSGQADLVVSDMRMPGMNGAQVLEAVRQRWPATHRIILSGQTDQSSLLEHIGVIHRYLQKPCDVNQIIQSIEQSLKLRDELKASRFDACVSQIESLPVMTPVYQELMAAIDDEETSVDDISKIVERDIGLTVKVLQLVNSAFYCLPRRVESVTDAVHRIGLSNLKSLALIAKLFETLESSDQRNKQLSQLWSASADIAAQAQMYAKALNQKSTVCADARLAGMLSLIGRAIMIAYKPDMMHQAIDLADSTGESLTECEREVFGVSQNIVGAYSLGIWAFDDRIIDAVHCQFNPSNLAGLTLAHPAVYTHAARSTSKATNLVDVVKPSIECLESVGFKHPQNDALENAA